MSDEDDDNDDHVLDDGHDRGPIPINTPPEHNGGGREGRVSNGKFAKGNKIGPGGGIPFSHRIAAIRKLLMAATSDEQVLKVWGAVCVAAEDGKMPAVNIFFDRLLGPSIGADVQEQLDKMEARIEKLLLAKSDSKAG